MDIIKETRYVGKRVNRIDAEGKVTGKLKYMSDLVFPDMLWGKVVRSPFPHAKILSIDISEAEKLEGVKCVLTHKDIPGLNGFGIVIQDQPVLCHDKVRFEGDAVALIAAETKEIASKAASLVKVEYEPLPLVDTTAKALDPDFEKVHESGNIHLENELKKGDLAKGFQESDITIECEYATQRMEHAFLETEGGVGIYHEKEGIIEIYCGAQHPYRDILQISRALNWDQKKIITHESPLGGGFGGKDEITIQIHLALLAVKTKRPVKIWLKREESTRTHVKRHPMELKFKLGATKEGIFKSLDVDIVSDTGAYASLGGPVLNLALEGAPGPYIIPNAHLRGRAMYTNNGISGAFRGFGTTQSCFGIESTIDQLSRKLNIDPIQLRLKNVLHKDDMSGIDHKIFTSVGIEETLKIAAQSELWQKRNERKKKYSHPYYYGVGTASEMQALGLGKDIPDFAHTSLHLLENGKIAFCMTSVDMGQGNTTTFAQMAADLMGCPIEDIEIYHGDTSKSKDSGSTSASRTLYVVGNSGYKASFDLKEKIEKTAEKATGKSFKYQNGELVCGNEKISRAEFAKIVKDKNLKDSEFENGVITGWGYFEHPNSDKSFGHGLPHCLYAFITQVCSIVVDSETGQVRVEEFLNIPDCGRALNPVGVEQQCDGGVAQGIGYALMEHCVIEEGKFMNPGFATYIFPTACDIPDKSETIIVESFEETHPFGAKGMAEPPAVASTPAIINAIYDAVGIRLTTLPATPEKILKALKEKK